MARRLRALVVLTGPGFGYQHPPRSSQPSITPARGSNALFWPSRAPGRQMLYIYTSRQTFLHILIKINEFSKKDLNLKEEISQEYTSWEGRQLLGL